MLHVGALYVTCTDDRLGQAVGYCVLQHALRLQLDCWRASMLCSTATGQTEPVCCIWLLLGNASLLHLQFTVLLYILGCCCWFGQLLMLLIWFSARLLVTLSPVCWRLLFRWLGCCSVLPREQQLHGRATVLCLCVAVFDSSLVSVCVMAQACVTGSVKGDTCPRFWTDFRVSRHQVAYNTGNLGNTMLSRY